MKQADLDAQNEMLVSRLPGARGELIVLNRRLVYVTVDRTLRLWPNFRHLRDDLIGEGMLALVRVVDRLVEVGTKTRPIRNYLITAIRNQLVGELVSNRSSRGQIEQITQYVDSYNQISEHVLAREDEAFAQLENREFFYSLCETEREREILTYYLAGKKAADIISGTEYTHRIVHGTLEHFREKLRESEGNLSGSKAG